MASAPVIRMMAEAGVAGRHWYDGARRELLKVAQFFDVPYEDVAAKAAILSPRMSVARSIKVLGNHLRGLRWSDDVHSAKRNAIGMYDIAKVVTGPKVHAFWRNLLGQYRWVTLDSWMAKALLPEGKTWSGRTATNPLQVKAILRIAEVAKDMGWWPAEVQAAVWSYAYEKANGRPAPAICASDATLEVEEVVNVA